PDEGARVRYRRARGLGSGLRRRERDRLWREDERRNLWGEGALGRCTRLSRPRADAWTAARWIGRSLLLELAEGHRAAIRAGHPGTRRQVKRGLALPPVHRQRRGAGDRKSTRLNSSH